MIRRALPGGCLAALYLIFPLALSQVGIARAGGFFRYLVLAAAGVGVTWLLTENILTTALTFLIFAIRAGARIQLGKIRREMAGMPGGIEAGAAVTLEEIPTVLDVPRIPIFGIFAAGYAFLLFAGRTGHLEEMTMLAVLGMLLYFLYRFADGMEDFVEQRRRNANVPVKSLRRTGWRIFLIFFLVLAVLALPVARFAGEPLADIRHGAAAAGAGCRGNSCAAGGDFPEPGDGRSPGSSGQSGGAAAMAGGFLPRFPGGGSAAGGYGGAVADLSLAQKDGGLLRRPGGRPGYLSA